MQPVTVRSVALTDERLSTSILVFLLAGMTLFAGLLSAQTPVPPVAPPKKPAPTVVPASAPVEGEVAHVVKRGDTL